MQLHPVVAVLATLVLFFLALAADPKSRYAFLAAVVVLACVACVFWPEIQPLMARR